MGIFSFRRGPSWISSWKSTSTNTLTLRQSQTILKQNKMLKLFSTLNAFNNNNNNLEISSPLERDPRCSCGLVHFTLQLQFNSVEKCVIRFQHLNSLTNAILSFRPFRRCPFGLLASSYELSPCPRHQQRNQRKHAVTFFANVCTSYDSALHRAIRLFFALDLDQGDAVFHVTARTREKITQSTKSLDDLTEY